MNTLIQPLLTGEFGLISLVAIVVISLIVGIIGGGISGIIVGGDNLDKSLSSMLGAFYGVIATVPGALIGSVIFWLI